MPYNPLHHAVLVMRQGRPCLGVVILSTAAFFLGCGGRDGVTELPVSSKGALLASSGAEPAPSRLLEKASYTNVQLSLSRAPENLRILTRPDGLHDVEILSGFRRVTILVKQPDGTLATHCTSDADAAARLLSGGLP